MFDREADVDLTVPELDEGPRVRMMRHFLSCIESGQQPITSVMTGYTNNLILDAIYQSSQTGNEVKLNWDIE